MFSDDLFEQIWSKEHMHLCPHDYLSKIRNKMVGPFISNVELQLHNKGSQA